MASSKYPTWWPLVRTLVLALAVGAGSGVIASVLVSSSLENYAARLLEEQRLPTVSDVTPSPVPGTYEEALRRVRQTRDASLALFVPASEDAVTPSGWTDVTAAEAYGVVVSDDGWVLTTAAALDAYRDPVTGLDVWIGGERYAIVSIVEDVLSDYRLVHVSGSGLNAAGFGPSNEMRAGEMVFALGADGTVQVTSLAQNDATVEVGSQPAEVFATSWMLSDVLPAGLPLVNATGDIVGVSGAEGWATPLHHAVGFVQQVLRNGSASYAAIGAYAVDLSRTLGVSAELRQGVDAGALILAPSANVRALVRGSSGSESGLAVRDIVLSIDGEAITSDVTIAEILSTYEPGQSARFSVLRGGDTMTLDVTFESYTDLTY